MLANRIVVQLHIHLAKQRVKRQVNRTNCCSIRQVNTVSVCYLNLNKKSFIVKIKADLLSAI